MSRTSAARAARCVSVIRSRRVAWASSTSRTACSALVCSRSIRSVGFLSQGRIADHAGVSRQDVGVLGTKAVTGFGPRQLHLAEGNIQRLIESGSLGSD